MSTTTTLTLEFRKETAQARFYKHKNGKEQWVPRSVCPSTFKLGNHAGALHEVKIEDWWLEKNPFETPDGEQPGLGF